MNINALAKKIDYFYKLAATDLSQEIRRSLSEIFLVYLTTWSKQYYQQLQNITAYIQHPDLIPELKKYTHLQAQVQLQLFVKINTTTKAYEGLSVNVPSVPKIVGFNKNNNSTSELSETLSLYIKDRIMAFIDPTMKAQMIEELSSKMEMEGLIDRIKQEAATIDTPPLPVSQLITLVIPVVVNQG